ncbi:MAG: T9SS type A sorting domain-containing protein [Bacteroidia bacterium]|nr:T9SS type A sorting domain-containing protein [Bacteroidia bacterium]MCZ2249941.1 T9SS type A sorting domain-containing protein [Bacteroidia bacterium]
MKKLILVFFLFISFRGFSQVFQQGDIFAEMNFNGYHDSTLCGTMGNLMYNVTINNSYLGDTLLVKDAGTNNLLSIEINNTGQNPWILSFQPFNMMPFVPDYMTLIQGTADFFPSPIKLKNGLDSIDNVAYFYQVPVINPCEYGDLNGRIYIDNNNDCTYNLGDDYFQSYYYISVNGSYSNNSSGPFYNFNAGNEGLFNIKVQKSYLNNGYITYSNPMLPFAYPNQCSPAVYYFDFNSPFPLNNLDFTLQCTSNVDVSVSTGSTGTVRPGVPFLLFPHAFNVGCDTVSGWLKLVLDSRVTYNPILSINPPNSISGDTLIWSYSALNNLGSNGFWNSMTAHVHLTPDTTVNIGDTLCFSTFSNIPNNDVNPANNNYTYCVPVVNSLDPNMKEVSPKGVGNNGVIPPSQTELTYTIHFQNTGNAPAINVSIIDTLDAVIIPESMEILLSSHSMTPQWLSDRIVKFNFNNINLADSISNEPASHGLVKFKVKLANNLPLGTQINNKAYIYFDFNAPIITNNVLNTIDILSSVKDIASNNITVYPNPATDEITIGIPDYQDNSSVRAELYNFIGQKVTTKDIRQNKSIISLKGLSSGIYFLQIHNGSESTTTKVVKE